MGAIQRTKGRRAEQVIVNLLKAEGFIGAKRNLMQTGHGGYDITGLEPLAIEVKDHKRLSIPQWWEQTVANASDGLIPVLIYHIPHTSRWNVQIPITLINPELESTQTATVSFEAFVCLAREALSPP